MNDNEIFETMRRHSADVIDHMGAAAEELRTYSTLEQAHNLLDAIWNNQSESDEEMYYTIKAYRSFRAYHDLQFELLDDGLLVKKQAKQVAKSEVSDWYPIIKLERSDGEYIKIYTMPYIDKHDL